MSQQQSASATRRIFLGSMAAAAASSLANASGGVRDDGDRMYPICAFIKFIQSLSYEELADQMSGMGFDGIEATVRKKGLIEPEAAPEQLPRLVEALKQRDLEVNVMTTGIVDANEMVARRFLETAASLGIKRYRMGYFRYDSKRDVVPQLAEMQPRLNELAALNRELGITAIYQNHAGNGYVGSTIWDLQRLLSEISPQEVGMAFDIRHATAEAGMSWPTLFRVATPHLQSVYVKDFTWDGRRPRNVPLGEGQVDPRFFRFLKETDFAGPISLHVEYLPDGTVDENLRALQDDLMTLNNMLADGGA